MDVGDEVKAGQTLMRVERSGTGEMYDVRSDKDGIISWIGVSKGIYVSSMQNTVLYDSPSSLMAIFTRSPARDASALLTVIFTL